MSQPPIPYSRLFSFETFSTANPTQPLPGVQVDNELNLVAQSLSATISRLNELQRADGKLRSEALDNTEIVNTVKLASYQATMDMLDSTIQSLNASAAASASSAEAASNSAASSSGSAAQAQSYSNAAASSSAQAFQYANLSEASYQSSNTAANLSNAAKLAAQAAASNAAAAAGTAVGTLSEALLLKTYLDTEYGDILQSWQNLNDLQNKHQAREHLGVQGDVSHAALFHEFKTTLRYFRPAQAASDVDDAEQLLDKWFGLVFNVTTDQFNLAADHATRLPVVFTEAGPIQWDSGGNLEDLNLRYPTVSWDMSVSQRVDILRMKLRAFGVVLTNSMLFLRDERQGKYKWPTTKWKDGQIGIEEWDDIRTGGTQHVWSPESGLNDLFVPVTENRFVTLEDFAQGADGATIPYVGTYVVSVANSTVLGLISQDAIDALGAASAPSYFNPFATTDWVTGQGYVVSGDLASGLALKLTNSINWTGDYDNGVTYSAGDGVKWNGEYFVLKDTIGAAGYDPGGYPASWTRLIPSGVGGDLFNQTLNTGDSVQFFDVQSESLTTGAMSLGSITFTGDSTVQPTAVPAGSAEGVVPTWNNTLSTWDTSASGAVLFLNNAGAEVVGVRSDSSTATVGGELYIAGTNNLDTYETIVGPYRVVVSEPSTGNSTTVTPGGITFLDSTTQTTKGLIPANNLSDLVSASTARTNLGLGTMAVETATSYYLASNPAGYVTAATAPVTSVAGKTGAVSLAVADVSGAAATASTNTFSASQVISVTDNSNAALRVTQLGTGEAFRVEDSANPDSTPFAIDASGNVVIKAAPNASYSLTILSTGRFTVGQFGHTSIDTSPDTTNWSLKVGNDNADTSEVGGFAYAVNGFGFYKQFVGGNILNGTGPYCSIGENNFLVKTASGATFAVNAVTATDFCSITIPAGSSTIPLTIQNNGTGNSFVVNDSAGDTTPFVINNDGQVGIRTTTLGTNVLTVNGNTAVTGTVAVTGGVTTTAANTFTVASGTAVPLTIQNNGTGVSFRVNDEASDTTPLIVDAGGNVGVKTASPSTDFEVNGNAKVTSLNIGTSAAINSIAQNATNPGIVATQTYNQEIHINIGGTVYKLPARV